jgi:hydrogenase maturation protease
VNIAVIGLGQDLRGDDGAGLEAIRLWRQMYPDDAGSADIRIRLITAPGLELADALGGVEAAIVVDATRGAGHPGTIRTLRLSEFEVSAAASDGMHGWQLQQELALGRLLGQYPANLVLRLIGIEAAQMRLGRELSRVVHDALPLASELIHTEIQSIRRL